MIDGIERMVRAECDASGSPHSPEVEYYDQYPLTENEPEVTEKITSAFRLHFGSQTVFDLGRVTASETSATSPMLWEYPTLIGGWMYRRRQVERALKAGRVEQEIPVNHSELSTGTQAIVVAALTYLAK